MHIEHPRRIAPVDPAEQGKGRALLALMRPQHWIKNSFVLAPLFFTPDAVTPTSAARAAAAALLFCLLASAVYVFNDYLDRAADRQHPAKRDRPIASGRVLPGEAAALFAMLALAGFGGAMLLGPTVVAAGLAYLLLNLAYSLWLKHRAILDVVTIAIGFVLRLEAGAMAVDIRPSAWIIICTGLLALFLGLAKRRDDLVRALGSDHRAALAGYTKPFIDAALTMVLGALLVSYAIYTTDVRVMQRMGSEMLYVTIPFVVVGVLRYLQIALVEEKSDSPTRIVLSDRMIMVSVLGWLATFALLIYP